MNTANSIVQQLHFPAFEQRGIKVFIKRDDLIHPVISGNKWRKLKYNVELCKTQKREGIVTFGGAYSNHLVATAAACELAGLASIGIVRGEELNAESNETLRQCTVHGMKLHFISREEYRMRNEKAYHEEIAYQFSNHMVVPEGGANYYGMIGCQELMREISEPIDSVFVAQGTSTTSCGILMSLKEEQELHVVPALKGYDSIGEMKELMNRSGIEPSWTDLQLQKVQIHPEYHFGGYGKYTEALLAFISNFHGDHGIKLDPVYTGKAMFAMVQELQSTRYNNTNVLFIHTGGIQGASALVEKIGFQLYG